MKILFTTISILTFLLGLTFDVISDSVIEGTDTTVNMDTEFNDRWVYENNYVVQMWGDCQLEDCGDRKSVRILN